MDADFAHRLASCAAGASLPRHDFLFALADKAASILEHEREPWRPCGPDGAPGGLLDFTAEPQEQLPLIVVPDLHARAYFLSNLLQFVPPAGFLAPECEGRSVLEALDAQAVRIVCVGDILHSELRGRGRWQEAWLEFLNGTETGPAMTAEMKEGLSLLAMVMELKCAFPACFHVLKGNHENIQNEKGGGNFPFCKFANEGEMVRLFIQKKYGDDVLLIISCFEKALPLAAAFRECVVSHAE
ncbi:MAG: hypothetical protein K2H09_01605, partial [Treponemataceae bacterium]|nr:hypothetical protein [Treponemataceae bacterium]